MFLKKSVVGFSPLFFPLFDLLTVAIEALKYANISHQVDPKLLLPFCRFHGSEVNRLIAVTTADSMAFIHDSSSPCGIHFTILVSAQSGASASPKK